MAFQEYWYAHFKLWWSCLQIPGILRICISPVIWRMLAGRVSMHHWEREGLLHFIWSLTLLVKAKCAFALLAQQLHVLFLTLLLSWMYYKSLGRETLYVRARKVQWKSFIINILIRVFRTAVLFSGINCKIQAWGRTRQALCYTSIATVSLISPFERDACYNLSYDLFSGKEELLLSNWAIDIATAICLRFSVYNLFVYIR